MLGDDSKARSRGNVANEGNQSNNEEHEREEVNSVCGVSFVE
jgi:hypothetical protein